MARGHAPKREAKKPRKKDSKKPVLTSAESFISADVEVVKKKRKPRDEDF